MAEHQHTQQVVRRLARIEGHVAAIKRMVAEGRPCTDVLLQLGAVRAAIGAAAGVLLADHLEHCVTGELAAPALKREMEGLQQALARYVR